MKRNNRTFLAALTTLMMTFAAVSFSAAGAFAANPDVDMSLSLDATDRCVIVYVKDASQNPSLTVACDGERVLAQNLPKASTLNDAPSFISSLYVRFQEMVNSSGRKTCRQFPSEDVWWASCLTE